MTLTPNILWFQTRDFVIFDILVKTISEIKIDISDNKFNFSSLIDNKLYEIEFDFYNDINKEESLYISNEKYIRVKLKKINFDKWFYLTKDKNIYKNNIKVNWNEWIDSDDEEEEDKSNQDNSPMNFDFAQMMQSMGGINNMQDMMNNNQFDLDNEETDYEGDPDYEDTCGDSCNDECQREHEETNEDIFKDNQKNEEYSI